MMKLLLHWVVDAGNYKFLIGTSSKDIKAVLDVDVVSVVEKTNDILKPQETVNTIKTLKVSIILFLVVIRLICSA